MWDDSNLPYMLCTDDDPDRHELCLYDRGGEGNLVR